MLLKLSRSSEQLTKSAVLDRAAEFVVNHPKGVALTAAAAGLAIPQFRDASRRAHMGLTKEWLEAQNEGLVPVMPPSDNDYSAFHRPARLGKLVGL